MKSNRTMKVKINKKHPRQSLKICRGYLFVFCGSIFIIRRSVCSVISPIRTSALATALLFDSSYVQAEFLIILFFQSYNCTFVGFKCKIKAVGAGGSRCISVHGFAFGIAIV